MKFVRWAVILVFAVLVALSFSSCALGAETRVVSATAGALTGTHSFPVNFPYAGEIVEVQSVALQGLSHADAENLRITLRSPGLQPVILSNYEGGTDDFLGTYTYVDSGSGEGVNVYVASAGIIVPTTYWAYGDLSDYDDKDCIGDWKLEIDGASAGTLSSWAITIQYRPY